MRRPCVRPLLPQRALLAVLLALSLVVACHRAPRPRAKVVTTIFPVYDLTRRITGPDADVILLEPPERSPHQYIATPGDLERSTGANLAVLIGLDLDAWLEGVVARVAPTARVLRLADRVPTLPRKPSLTDEVEQAQHDAHRAPGAPDPRGVAGIDVHVWLDPQRALLMGRAITDELCRVDPGHATAFRQRGLELTTSLESLDRELEARTGTWKERSFATLHDGFRYFAARYHLDVAVAVEAIPGVRPNIRYEQLVVRRLRERGAAGLFGEPQLDSQPAQTLAQVTHVPYGVLDPIGGTGGVDSYEALIRSVAGSLETVLLIPRAPSPAPFAAATSSAAGPASAAPSPPPP